MKKWDREELKKMYPPMTEAFSARMTALIDALPSREEEQKMKKKFSLGLALALALILALTATAVAAGLGVFGRLADAHDPDARLGDLENVAAPVKQIVTTPEGVTVTIDQAYYDGERVIVSYQLSGSVFRKEDAGRGTLENLEWFDGGEYDIAVDPDSPAAAVIEEVRVAEKDTWVRVATSQLHDGLSLADGTYLDIIGGEERLLPDGTVIGWKECEVPEDKAADALDCKAVLFSVSTTYQRTDKGLRAAYERAGENVDIPFTVRMEKDVKHLAGESAADGVYTAQAECTLSAVDLRCTVTLKCPENWVRAWMDWDFERDFDLIEGWALYSGDSRIGDEGNDRGVWGEGDRLVYEEIIRHEGNKENLRLVPVYADSGEHPEEGIMLVIGE